MIWTPHATVATIVEHEHKFLLVEELSEGKSVFNQPAGHIEENESIFDAAIRETLEESGYLVELTGLTGIYTYLAPSNGVTYYRFCFAAKLIEHQSNKLDPDIIAAHWLSAEQINNMQAQQWRSPLVPKCIADYQQRTALPLDYIYQHPISG